MEIFIAALIVFVAAFVQGVTAFGSGLILMPGLLLLYDIQFVTPAVALLSVAMNLVNLHTVRKNFEWAKIRNLLIGALFGVPIGVWILKNCEPLLLKRALGGVLVLYSIYALAKPKLQFRLGDRTAYPFGLLAGLVGGAYNVSGPPLAIYCLAHRFDKRDTKMIMSTFLLINGIMICLTHFAVGMVSQGILVKVMFGLPLLWLGVHLGAKLFDKVDQQLFSRLVYGMIIVLGTMMFR